MLGSYIICPNILGCKLRCFLETKMLQDNCIHQSFLDINGHGPWVKTLNRHKRMEGILSIFHNKLHWIDFLHLENSCISSILHVLRQTWGVKCVSFYVETIESWHTPWPRPSSLQNLLFWQKFTQLCWPTKTLGTHSVMWHKYYLKIILE